MMASKSDLIQRLNIISQKAKGSFWQRWMFNPWHYVTGMLFYKLLFPFLKQSWPRKTNLFFGGSLTVALPAGLDIYILGAKGHDSEIRLGKFLINHLQKGHHFIDVGGHLGFFSLLAAHLVGESGRVFGFEASSQMFEYYNKNVANHQNIEAHHKAISDFNGEIQFFEYPILYSEYNTTINDQYKNENWSKNNIAKSVKVPCLTLEDFISERQITIDFIKIDVEGGELKVLTGLENVLISQSPVIIMEYLKKAATNNDYQKAAEKLMDVGYQLNVINTDGILEISSLEDLEKMNFESDNIVFRRT